MKSRRIAVLVAMLVLIGASAYAQEPGKVGITMGYPSAVGIIWHAAPRLAVRPELSISQTSGDTTSPSPIGSSQTNDSWQLGFGVSGLVYVAQWDALHAYVSPRFTYSRASSTSSSAGLTIDGTTRAYLAAGSFGAEYSLGKRFAVFGELGAAYTSAKTTSSSSGAIVPLTVPLTAVTTHIHGVGMRSDIGVIVYF